MKKLWKNVPLSFLEEECIQYLEDNPVLGKVLSLFCEKYKSYGVVAGSVDMGKVTSGDMETLEGFFQKNYHGKPKIRITAKNLEKALINSKFAEISSQRLLELYFKEEITSKADQKKTEESKQTDPPGVPSNVRRPRTVAVPRPHDPTTPRPRPHDPMTTTTTPRPRPRPHNHDHDRGEPYWFERSTRGWLGVGGRGQWGRRASVFHATASTPLWSPGGQGSSGPLSIIIIIISFR